MVLHGKKTVKPELIKNVGLRSPERKGGSCSYNIFHIFFSHSLIIADQILFGFT